MNLFFSIFQFASFACYAYCVFKVVDSVNGLYPVSPCPISHIGYQFFWDGGEIKNMIYLRGGETWGSPARGKQDINKT